MEATIDRGRTTFVEDVVGAGSASRSDRSRLALGTALAFVFALAAGATHPTLDLPVRALVVPLATLASSLFALPTLAVLLPLVGPEVPPAILFASASRGVAASGLVLAGLAPLLLLYAVTASDGPATCVVFFVAWALAFFLGTRATLGGIAVFLRANAADDAAPIALLALAIGLSILVAIRLSFVVLDVVLLGKCHAY